MTAEQRNSSGAALALPAPTAWSAAQPAIELPATVAGQRAWMVRAWALALLLLGELLLLTIRFDTQSILAKTGDWGQVFTWAPRLLQMAIAIGAAFCLSGRVRLAKQLRNFAVAGATDRLWQMAAVLQIVSFAALAVTTYRLYEDVPLQSAAGLVWGAAWAILVSLTASLWLRSLAPPGVWRAFLSAEWKSLLLGTVIGAGSLVLTQSTRALWEPLASWTLFLVAALLRCIFSDIVIDEATQIIGTEAFRVQIAPQCSGCEGLGLMTLFLAAFCFSFYRRLRFPQAWLLWPLGLLMIWICNSLRIALLIVIGSLYSPAVALGGFHSQAGWIFFNFVALSLAAFSLRMPFFSKDGLSTEQPLAEEHSKVTGYLAPFLVLMATNIAAAALTNEFDWLYPGKVLITLAALAMFPQGWKALRVGQDLWHLRWRNSVSPLLNGALVFAIWMSLAAATPHDEGVPLAIREAPPLVAITWIMFRILGSVVTVPIVEELAFRGYLMRRLATPSFENLSYRAAPLWSIAVSALAFGCMHQRWFAGTLAGVAYAFAARRQNSLRDAVLAHAVTNGLIAASVLACDAWWLW